MLELKKTGEATVVELARGKGNSLDTAFLRDIRGCFAELRKDPPRGVVLTASGRVFCAGLDLARSGVGICVGYRRSFRPVARLIDASSTRSGRPL